MFGWVGDAAIACVAYARRVSRRAAVGPAAAAAAAGNTRTCNPSQNRTVIQCGLRVRTHLLLLLLSAAAASLACDLSELCMPSHKLCYPALQCIHTRYTDRRGGLLKPDPSVRATYNI